MRANGEGEPARRVPPITTSEKTGRWLVRHSVPSGR